MEASLTGFIFESDMLDNLIEPSLHYYYHDQCSISATDVWSGISSSDFPILSRVSARGQSREYYIR